MRCIKCASPCGFAKRICDACKAIKARGKKKPEPVLLPPDGPTRQWSSGYVLASMAYRPRVAFAATIPDDNAGVLEACPWLR